MLPQTLKNRQRQCISSLASLVALDLRSLGLFRIGLAGLIIIDLCFRAQDLVALYTDSGVLPLSQLIFSKGPTTWISPYLLANTPLEVAMLFSIAGIAALGMLIGIKTRWMVAVSWILLHSLQMRNPYVNHAGDKLLLLMLFWGFFLPLDKRYTLAYCRNRKGTPELAKGHKVASCATAGILIQFASVYFMGALRKTGSMWHEGSAIWYTLHIDQYAWPWTRILTQYSTILQGLTYLTLAIEFTAPLLLFAGLTKVRGLSLLLIAALHLGFLVCLDLGLFPIISLVICSFAIPWNRARHDAPPNDLLIAPLDWKNRIAGYLMATLVLWNCFTITNYPEEIKEKLPNPITAGLEFIRFDQYWSMFAPNPMTIDGWYVIPATLESGKTIDLLRGGTPVSWEKPKSVPESFPSDRWKEYLMTLSDLGDPQKQWSRVGRVLSQTHNRKSPDQVIAGTIRVVYMMEKTTAIGEETPIQELAWPIENSL